MDLGITGQTAQRMSGIGWAIRVKAPQAAQRAAWARAAGPKGAHIDGHRTKRPHSLSQRANSKTGEETDGLPDRLNYLGILSPNNYGNLHVACCVVVQ